MPIVSVIIPIYGIKEGYLRRAIESAQSQTLRDIEIILIDDGSPDDCGAICDEYAAKDRRIKVLHKKNAGVSAARNDGLKMAQGQWINFLDPDDWMPSDALEQMTATAQNHQADIVIGGLKVFYEDVPGPYMGFPEKIQVLDGVRKEDYMFNLICRHFEEKKHKRKDFGQNYQGAPWGKLFSKKLLGENEISFLEGLHPYEDTLLNVYAVLCAERIVLVRDCVYFYRINQGSVTVKFKSTWVDNNLLYISRIETLLKEYDSGEKSPIINDVFCGCIAEKVLSLLSVYFFHKDNPKKQSQVYRELDEFSQNRYLQKALCSLNNPLYTLKQKVILWCLKKRMYFVLKCLVFLNSKLKLLRRK